MINVDDARKKLEEKYSDISVKSAHEYGNRYYLFVATTEGSDNEPWYIVDKYNGKSRYLNPFEDFDAFIDATENHLIKKY